MRRTTHFVQFGVPSTPLPPFEPLARGTVTRREPTAVRLRSGDATIEVTALADGIFRVGLFGEGQVRGYRSDAVAKQDWPAAAVTVNETPAGLELRTSAAKAIITLDPLRIGFADSQGNAFAEDDEKLGMGFVPIAPAVVDPLGAPARVYKRHTPATHYFGCGERTGGLDKTGSRQVFWNVDPPSGHTAALNNLYTSVPFVLALEDGRAWGMFVDSTYRIEFDLANEDARRCGYAVDGGPLIYYVFAGPTPADVLERYTELTGRIPMPPRWTLGNHQSRWGYKSADELRTLAREFRARGIPLDVLYLDIDYMDGYRVFTWHPERFPDPVGLMRDLAELGVKVVTIVDPGVKTDDDYPVYQQGAQGDLFCKTFFGDEYRNVVWPGMCAFPDFTNPRTRAWWGELHAVLLDAGVAGVWCDMNEPTMFVPTPSTMPDDVAHHGDGEARLHAQVHNVYGQLMARAAHEGLKKLRPERRPFVISRSGFAGLQRWAMHWTGDNSSWWEHLWMSMPQLQNLGLSGYAWVGVDIGGFSGDATGELVARWTEFGIFQPFCRNHSAIDTRPQEPWQFGEHYERLICASLLLRQRLVPYLYTLFEAAHRTGAPILRPLLWDSPGDEETYAADDEFLVGSGLLVAPIARPGTEYRHVYVPRGTWVHYWTGERISGPQHILVHAPLGQPAFFVRANTPVPLWPEMAYDAEKPADPLTWLICVAPDAAGEGILYEDAGDGYGFEHGDFARSVVRCRVADGTVVIELGAVEGTYDSGRRTIELELRGVARPRGVTLDGQAWSRWEHERAGLVVSLDAGRQARRVEVEAELAHGTTR